MSNPVASFISSFAARLHRIAYGAPTGAAAAGAAGRMDPPSGGAGREEARIPALARALLDGPVSAGLIEALGLPKVMHAVHMSPTTSKAVSILPFPEHDLITLLYAIDRSPEVAAHYIHKKETRETYRLAAYVALMRRGEITASSTDYHCPFTEEPTPLDPALLLLARDVIAFMNSDSKVLIPGSILATNEAALDILIWHDESCFHTSRPLLVSNRSCKYLFMQAAQLKLLGPFYEYASREILEDKAFAIAFMSNPFFDRWPSLLSSFQSDLDVVLSVAQNNPKLLKTSRFPSSIWDNIPILMAAVAHDGLLLEHANDTLTRLEHELFYHPSAATFEKLAQLERIVLAAVKQNGNALKFATVTFRKNFGIVHAAVSRNGSARDYADPTLRAHPEILLAASRTYPIEMLSASDDLRKDRAFVKKAVSVHGVTLKCFPDFHDDDEIVKLASDNFGEALLFASPRLKKSKPHIMVALSNNSDIIRFLDLLDLISVRGRLVSRIGADADIMLAALKCKHVGARILRYAHHDLRSNEAFMLQAIQINPDAANWAWVALRDKKSFALASVALSGLNLKFVSERLQKDEDVVFAATKNDKRAIIHAHKELKIKRKFIIRLINECDLSLAELPEELRDMNPLNRPVILAAVKKRGSNLHSAAPDWRDMKEIALLAVENDGTALMDVGPTILEDEDITDTALKQNGLALEYASPTAKKRMRSVEIAIRNNGAALRYADIALQMDPRLKRIAELTCKLSVWRAHV